jgi:CMP/dCMP kinase
MIISISGNQGSGKSTIAKMLAEKLSWPRYYMGKIRREAAREKGMTLAEYNKLGEKDPSTDLEVDNYQKKLGESEANFVIEGRTSWYFIPHSLKIYLYVKTEIGAQRIFNHLQSENQRNEAENLNSVEDVIKSIKERHASDIKRYEKYFKIDVHDINNYDFYLDTSDLEIQEVFEKTYSFVKKKLESSCIDKK